MDIITHTLVGASLGEAGLKRRSGLAMAALIIGANLPDVDVLYEVLAKAWTFHRGLTHSVLAMLVLPVILTGALVAFDRLRSTGKPTRSGRAPIRPKQLLLLSAIAVLSHLLLDLLNPWGVRLLMPFSDRWFYGDALWAFDPWVFIALVAGIVVARVRARSARPEVSRSSTRPAQIALVVSAAYVALMVLGGRVAERIAARYIIATEHRTPRRVLATPVPANSFRRELVLDFGDTYRFGRMDWLPRPRVILDERDVPTNLRHPAVQAVRGRPAMQVFLYWSRYPFFRIEEDARPPAVIAGDAGRFGRSTVLRVPYAAEK
ncbi:MAG: metal-dependent hydrolase [Gemmatimonas sp.]